MAAASRTKKSTKTTSKAPRKAAKAAAAKPKAKAAPKSKSAKAVAKKPAARKPAAPKVAAAARVAGPVDLGAPKEGVILNPAELDDAVESIVDQIVAEFPTPAGLMILGIRTGGAVLAARLKTLLDERYKGAQVGLGTLDITLYRDDLSALGPQPDVRDSEIPFNVTGAHVIIVDDVLFTGRTIRAALDEIVDFGRPALIRLAVLIDRGLREYPIQADYAGVRIRTTRAQSIKLHLRETDGTDEAILLAAAPAAPARARR